MNKKGVCVQVGLHTSAEYIYLTDSNWRESMLDHHEVLHIPDSIVSHIDKWEYYGIDENFFSIDYLARKYESKGNWLVAYLTDRLTPFKKNISQRPPEFNPCEGIYVPTVTLSELFRRFRLDYVDVLALDIESAEHHIFDTYDWHIYPTYIAVEVHSFDHQLDNACESIIEKLRAHGYTPVNQYINAYQLVNESTRCDVEFPSMEIQFIRGGGNETKNT